MGGGGGGGELRGVSVIYIMTLFHSSNGCHFGKEEVFCL